MISDDHGIKMLYSGNEISRMTRDHTSLIFTPVTGEFLLHASLYRSHCGQNMCDLVLRSTRDRRGDMEARWTVAIVQGILCH